MPDCTNQALNGACALLSRIGKGNVFGQAMYFAGQRPTLKSQNQNIYSPNQTLCRLSTSQRRTNILILITLLNILGRKPMFSRPNLLARILFSLKVLGNNIPNRTLEEQRRLLELRVELSRGKYATLEIPLCVDTEDFVFAHHPRVHVTD